MILSQKFIVISQGLIEGGTAQFEIDPITGRGTYGSDIKAGEYGFNFDYPAYGVLNFPPSILLGKTAVPGLGLSFNGLTAQISFIDDKRIATAAVELVSSTMNLSGSALIDCSSEYIVIRSVSMTGNANGYDVTVELHPAP
jgi:hypothetical protein